MPQVQLFNGADSALLYHYRTSIGC